MIASIFTRALRNKHTTGAGLAYGAAWLFESIGPIWFPTHVAQITATADQVRKACFMYATIMGADAGSSALTPSTEQPKDLSK